MKWLTKVQENKETYIITEYSGKLSHPNKNCWRMSLSEPILSSNKGPDIFQFTKSSMHWLKIEIMMQEYLIQE